MYINIYKKRRFFRECLKKDGARGEKKRFFSFLIIYIQVSTLFCSFFAPCGRFFASFARPPIKGAKNRRKKRVIFCAARALLRFALARRARGVPAGSSPPRCATEWGDSRALLAAEEDGRLRRCRAVSAESSSSIARLRALSPLHASVRPRVRRRHISSIVARYRAPLHSRARAPMRDSRKRKLSNNCAHLRALF